MLGAIGAIRCSESLFWVYSTAVVPEIVVLAERHIVITSPGGPGRPAMTGYRHRHRRLKHPFINFIRRPEAFYR
jgi:hypothetical protein